MQNDPRAAPSVVCDLETPSFQVRGLSVPRLRVMKCLSTQRAKEVSFFLREGLDGATIKTLFKELRSLFVGRGELCGVGAKSSWSLVRIPQKMPFRAVPTPIPSLWPPPGKSILSKRTLYLVQKNSEAANLTRWMK